MKVKWGKEVYNEVELNTDEEPMVFKAQLFALTGVQPHRQKVMIKGAALKDDSWDNFKPKVKNGATLLLMGSRDEDHLKAPDPAQKTKVSGQGFFFDIWSLTQGRLSSNSGPIFA